MTFADEVDADSPYLWWDTRQMTVSVQPDRSGNGRTGTVIGFPSRDASNGATFDNSATGDDDWVLGDTSLGPGDVGSTFTIEVVCAHDKTKQNVDSFNTAACWDGPADHLPIAIFWGGTGADQPTTWATYTGPLIHSYAAPAVTDTDVHHLLLTFDGTVAETYIDGVLLHTDSTISGSSQVTFPVEAGRFAVGNDQCACADGFGGLVRHAVYYDTGLDATRVAAHAAAALADDPAPGGGGGGEVSGYTPVLVTLNGFAMNDTVDGDGIEWCWQALDGWWDSADIRAESSEAAAMGLSTTTARRNGRPITLTVLAHAVNQSAGLQDLIYKADRRLKSYLSLVNGPGLLVVAEPDITLESYVHLVQPIRRKVLGTRAMVQFQVPLLADDPRRYNSTETTDSTSLTLLTTDTSVDINFTNNGSLPTPPVFEVSGPATNPHVRNLTLDDSPIVAYLGVIGGGDTLVFDLANLTATLNGVSVIGDLRGTGAGSPPEWWQLQPGINLVRLHRSAGSGTVNGTITYQDAYE